MKARDIYKAACGRDILGENKALVKVQTGFIGKNDLEETEEDHIDIDNPVVEIHQNSRLTLVNLIFDDYRDPDYIYLSDMVKKFQVSENSADDERAPGIAVTIMPKEIEGSFIHGVSGIALLQSSSPMAEFDTVSLVFTNDCIHAYMLDLDRIDSDQLEADVFLEEHFGEKRG